jgi:hypothetical protein
MWSNIRAGLGPARPNEGTAWFRAGLGHCFYTSGWHGTTQKLFGLSWPEPVWHEARWAWAGPARHGPIPSTIWPQGQNELLRGETGEAAKPVARRDASRTSQVVAFSLELLLRVTLPNASSVLTGNRQDSDDLFGIHEMGHARNLQTTGDAAM